MPDMVLHETFKQIEGQYQTCFAGNAMETFLKSCEMSKDEDSLNMEDDIILTENFLAKAMEQINMTPAMFISFFTLKNSIEKTSMVAGRTFCMHQCVYQPAWLNKGVLEYYPTWKETKRGKENPTGNDLLVADYLASKSMNYILYQPSLVQHMIMKSRINPKRSTKRQSKTFK